MELGDFKKIIENRQKESERQMSLYDLGVDLLNFHNYNLENEDILLHSIYTEEGMDWFDWFLYEKLPQPNTNDIKAWDENGIEILKTVEELYEYLEENYLIKK